MKIQIRCAQSSDSAAISQIYAASWRCAYRGMVPQQYLDELRDDFWTEKFQLWLSRGALQADLAFVDGKLAGCVAYGNSRYEKRPGWGEIVSIYIHPDFYRKGMGTRLLQSALSYLKAQNCEGCFLWVLRENRNAQRFYEKNGFTPSGDTCLSEIMGEQLTDLCYCHIFRET